MLSAANSVANLVDLRITNTELITDFVKHKTRQYKLTKPHIKTENYQISAKIISLLNRSNVG